MKLYASETTPYVKLQVFRVLIEVSGLRRRFDNETLLKYINEQFHVENDYMFCLDLNKFDVVPSFVLPACDEFLGRHGYLPKDE